LKADFGIPEEHILITVVVIGFPGDESFLNEKHLESEHSTRTRKPESEVIMSNAWVSK
jgi:hypothetical protein